MRALILAAGVGSRLRPLTDEKPKPMLEVDGVPILAYNLAMLATSGFRDVVLNVHHLPNAIRRYVGDGSRWGLNVSYSVEPVLLGTAGALVPVMDRFTDGTFAIVFGDNLMDLDLPDLVRRHEERRAVATIALWHRDDVSRSGVAEIDENDRVHRFSEKPEPAETTSHWVNAGLVVAEPELLKFVPRRGHSDLGGDVLPALVRETERVFGYRMNGGLWWFDRNEDYYAALTDPELQRFVASRSAAAKGIVP
jgi:NDP-sugar pyrophosphorylase family protein